MGTLFVLAGSLLFGFVLTVSAVRAHDTDNPEDSEFSHLECYKIKDDKIATDYILNLELHDKNFLPSNVNLKTCTIKQTSGVPGLRRFENHGREP